VAARGQPPNAFERAILELARKSVEAPARLAPEDLTPLREATGDGAITYTIVLSAFHFINRIADLLCVDPEALPESLRRFETLRRMSVRLAGRMFRSVDLRNRTYDVSFDAAVGALAAAVGDVPVSWWSERLTPLRPRPAAVEVLQHAIAERDRRSSLGRDVLARVQRGVEAALPAGLDESRGFHARPTGALDAFVFVGTRYAARTTRKMIDALRAEGWDDVGIMDLAIAIADANQWARTHRLLGLDPDLFYLEESVPGASARSEAQRSAAIET
jgi:alkylhydroperoxidase family enzyme